MKAEGRHLRNGLLRPWVVDYAEGIAEQARLKDQGLDLDLDPFELHALGVAVSEQRGEGHEPAPDLTLSPELDQALDLIIARRIAQTTPEKFPYVNQGPDQGERPPPPPTATERDQDQAQAQTAPERTAKSTAEDPPVGIESTNHRGQGRSATRQVRRNQQSKHLDPLREDLDELQRGD